jgi:hypothetical protein
MLVPSYWVQLLGVRSIIIAEHLSNVRRRRSLASLSGAFSIAGSGVRVDHANLPQL